MVTFIRSITPQLADAEDILQETARQFATRFDDYDQSRPFLPWEMGILKYKVLAMPKPPMRATFSFLPASVWSIEKVGREAAAAEVAEVWRNFLRFMDIW